MFYEVSNVPAFSCVLVGSRDAAVRCPKGDIKLGFCDECGFIQNIRFRSVQDTYTPQYDGTQFSSTRFKEFATRLAKQLIDRYDIRQKDVVEIGCGKGEFLSLICELGGNRGVGIDPASPTRPENEALAARVRFINDFYSEKYSQLPADIVICRHTLEHIESTSEFVRIMRRTIGDRPGTIVFFEVPDTSRILKELAFWDVYYEHCSYFSLGSLERLFSASGFKVLEVKKDFDDQYLLLEACPYDGPDGGGSLGQNEYIEELALDVENFRAGVAERIEETRKKLTELTRKRRRFVLWGSGSKAIAYMCTTGIGQSIEYVVDINPDKQGKYLPGTGQEIVAPNFLKEYRPDAVIVMNPTYAKEIKRALEDMRVSAEILTV